MRAVLIINPSSGVSALATNQGPPETYEEMILAALRLHGIEPEVLHTTPEDGGYGLAAQVVKEQAAPDIVIAAGGDGTVHEVARGLLSTQCVLGIIPTGTMNNVARSLDIPNNIEAACAIIATGETRAVDMGKINDAFFMEVAGIGIEAALFPAGEEVKRFGFFSTLHGIFSGLKTLFAFQPTKLKLSFDGQKYRRYEAIQITICNAPFYGAHFQLIPYVAIDDGLLDVVIYKNFSKLEYIRHAISISQGKRVFQPKIVHRLVKALRISTERSVEIQVDGFLHGHTPATVTILPGALRVRAPQGDVPRLDEEGYRVESKSKA